MMDEKLKRVADDMKKQSKKEEDKSKPENAEANESKDGILKNPDTYESLTNQLFNIHAGHSKLISEIRNKNVGVVKQLLEHIEK